MSSNLERAQNLADAGQYEQSIARSLIVIAAALKMQVEGNEDSNYAIKAYNQGYEDATFDIAKDKEQAFIPLLNEEEATRLHDDWCLDPNCSSSNRGMSNG